MRSKVSVCLLVVVLSSFCVVPVGVLGDPASPQGLPNDQWEPYRLPWPERITNAVGQGCQNGGMAQGVPDSDCTGHVDSNYYAIDFGTMACGAPIRADALGTVQMISSAGYGNLLVLKHPDGQGSWFAHLPSATLWDNVFGQGDYVSGAGTTGHSTGCHLHYQVNNNQAGPGDSHTAVDQNLSGILPISHLSSQWSASHPTNSTGAGYGRPYSGTCPPWLPGGLCADRGPDNQPLVSSIRQYARDLAAFTVDAGSTRGSIQGPCGANRRWVKGCYFNWGVYKYSQNFVLDYLGLQIPLSITEGYPGGTARRVMKAMWKAYGQKCGSDYTYLRIGRPTNEEFDLGSPFTQQNFERGFMQAWRNDPFNVMVYVFDNSGGLLCTQGAGSGGFYDWLDMDHEPCYDVNSDSWVDSGDQGTLGRRCCTSETDPINTQRPGYNYDDRYDVNRDGYVDSGDQGLLNRQIAQHGGSLVCK